MSNTEGKLENILLQMFPNLKDDRPNDFIDRKKPISIQRFDGNLYKIKNTVDFYIFYKFIKVVYFRVYRKKHYNVLEILGTILNLEFFHTLNVIL